MKKISPLKPSVIHTVTLRMVSAIETYTVLISDTLALRAERQSARMPQINQLC